MSEPEPFDWRVNAETCAELAASFRRVADALEAGEIRLGPHGGGRQVQRVRACAEVFERVAEDESAL